MQRMFVACLALAATSVACAEMPVEDAVSSAATINPGPGSIPLTADEPLRLLTASQAEVGCSSCMVFSGAVEVLDLAYDKAVDVVYGCPVNESAPEGEWVWRSAAAEYTQSLMNGSEIWSFYVKAPGCFHHLRFAVRYGVSGASHWDNNCGWDYEIRVPAGSSSGGTSGRPRSCL